MIIQDIVVHLIEKQADSGPSNLSLSQQSIAPSPSLEHFLEELNKVYNSKPSKIFGSFIDTEVTPSSHNKSESEADNPFASSHFLLSKHLREEITFIDYTHQSMNLLKHYIDQASKATGGYMVFVNYTLFGSDFMLIAMLNNVAGVSIDTNLGINSINYLDINKFHLAARIDLSLWRDDPESGRYISMIRGKESNKLSEYFRKFIGSDETIDSKQETSELFSAVSQFCDTKIQDNETKSQFKQKAADFCLEQADKGQNVVIKDFSGYVADNAVDDFMNYVNSEKFSLSDEISPNKTVIRRFNKISGRNQQVSITINEEALGDTVIYDADKETLTLSDLPATLKAQLLNR
ncbi:MAG: nucleoid-associated protein [gamma proteobacterium symbiont of Bathyaustriella thionipta]|nr:nucleoid-associated protein [gamma proteobacterium symbiont of Bathyaustriella thionipta]MCU7951060.1 nucleoid-associated protein [gamma proteobacterium symbiont of Bathyaustriella thionipta]MCU7953816.1 nucleoid-associated protein [gamma proteobacterium symbiont of Bathyaustriella thionipta]MCU7957597.1 nucleoid-associated protein [gamma proteobacterium symbiont of Bathyaustriella thionipta]MCU7966883.1 nucleoid-associated protein [gamma proteobacterium symbiont of Bathyaustriella thionipta